MRCLPGFAVVGLPFAFETFRVTGVHPEFRLFKMDGFRARIERALHADAEKLSVVSPGAHVVNIAAVTALLSVRQSLRLVLVIDAVEAAIEIILIVAPRHAGHDMDAITMIAPSLNPVRQFCIYAIDNGYIRTQV